MKRIIDEGYDVAYKIIKKKMADDPEYIPTREEQMMLLNQESMTLTEMLREMGNERFFKPSDLGDDTWKKQFENMEWDVDVDIVGEATNTREMMATLNTALQLVVQPGFEENKRAQSIVGKILELTNAMSPVEYYAIPPNQQAQPAAEQQPSAPAAPPVPLPTEQITTN